MRMRLMTSPSSEPDNRRARAPLPEFQVKRRSRGQKSQSNGRQGLAELALENLQSGKVARGLSG